VSADALDIKTPKLPKLSARDIKAVRSFLPRKLLGRTAALLSLVLLILGLLIRLKTGLAQLLGIDVAPWAYGILGLCFLAVVAQSVLEWSAERNRRRLRALAIRPGVEQTGYFRIGPYQDSAEDRAKFSRPDRAAENALQWIRKSSQIPLYLIGDSGSGKSSLLNAYVLPKLREEGWTIMEARAWQDALGALRSTLQTLIWQPKSGEDPTLTETIEQASKRASKRLLIVLDQFEEFLILSEPERQVEFATFIADIQSRSVKNTALLLVLRSDYQTFLEEIGLPPPRSGENLFQLARFRLPAANAFMKQSGLKLQPDALERLLASAAELDETPGLVRPITLNVVGYVLASGTAVAASLDAGVLVRNYIEQTVEQPVLRDRAPRVLEEMITEQGTKRPRSEQDLAAKAELRSAEVRAVLNGLGEAALARPLDPTRGTWELSHDFIARGVARFLGRRRRQVLRRAVAYAAPALLAISLLAGAGIIVWERFSPTRIRAQLAELGIHAESDMEGISARAVGEIDDESLSKAIPILVSLGKVSALRLNSTEITSLEPLQRLTTLRSLDISKTRVANLEPLQEFTSLQSLELPGTLVANLEPLQGLTALRSLTLSKTPVVNLEPLNGLTALQSLDVSVSQVASLGPLQRLTALQQLNVSGTLVASLEPLKGLTTLQSLDVSFTQAASLEPLQGLTSLLTLKLSGTPVVSLEPIKSLPVLRLLDLSFTRVASLEPLRRLTSLLTLKLSGTPVANLEPLQTLSALVSLEVADTQVADLEPLHGLTALQWLKVRGTHVVSLEPLKRFTALDSLDVSETQVFDLEPLRGLVALRWLGISRTPITSLEPINELPNLAIIGVRSRDEMIHRFIQYRRERHLPIGLFIDR
jgi:Leucine-rich repeat (LRR) protein